MPYLERLALRRSHQAQQRAPEVGLVTALVRCAPRRRERNPDRFETWRSVGESNYVVESRGAIRRARLQTWLTSVVLAGAMVPTLVVESLRGRRLNACSFPEVDTGRMLGDIIEVAVPQYVAAHPEGGCPSYAALRPWLDRADARDGWGTPIYMHCTSSDPLSMRVVSAGPDRRFWTDDDLELRQRDAK